MKTLKSIITIAVLSTSFVACNNNTAPTGSTNVKDSIITNNIVVNPLPHAKEFPGATLSISSISSEKVGTDSAKITVKYNVESFNLTEQTEHSHQMANSHDGQHIHFILDNTPYTALYKPEHSVTVPLNSKHTLLSFLSRSFHESIKTASASKLIAFNIDKDGKLEQLPQITDPSIFYSRPKGDYKGEETKTLLLDFFIENTTLSAEGNRVKADINGEEFILDQWVPYEILNLPLGETKINLTLVDKDGKDLVGENISVERKINLLEK